MNTDEYDDDIWALCKIEPNIEVLVKFPKLANSDVKSLYTNSTLTNAKCLNFLKTNTIED